MRFKTKTKEYRLIVRVKASFGEAIDEKELDRFSRVYLRGFLRPKLIKKNHVEYTGPVGISLQERLRSPITKRDFLFIMEQIVVAVEKLQSNQLPLDHLVMDIQHVFVNEVTKEMQFVYLPMKTARSGQSLAEFIEAIVYSVKPMEDKDSEFASRFIYFFRAIKPFDVARIESFISKEDRSVVNTIRKQNAGQSGFMTDKQQHYYDHYQNKENDEEATGLLDEEATGLLEDEATGLLCDDEATGLLCEGSVSGGTAVKVKYPVLFRLLTEEEIQINKPVFRLGKERSYVDYFVTNNIAVSRSHADIITRGEHHFVKDLNSKNHTYINGKELPVQCEVEIRNGDHLTLGNEEFVFHQ